MAYMKVSSPPQELSAVQINRRLLRSRYEILEPVLPISSSRSCSRNTSASNAEALAKSCTMEAGSFRNFRDYGLPLWNCWLQDYGARIFCKEKAHSCERSFMYKANAWLL